MRAVRERGVEIMAGEATQCVDGQRRGAQQLRYTRPAERLRVRMRWRRRDRAQHREVEPELRRSCELRAVVARRGAEHAFGPYRRALQSRGSPMHSRTVEPQCQCRVTLEQYLRARGLR